MAEFQPALRFTLQDEGGYANTPGDKGGETYEGIARNFWPHWLGWQVIDASKDSSGVPHGLAQNADLQADVEAFYRAQFWPGSFDHLVSQSIASKLFDECVNMGMAHGVKCLQQAVGGLAVDGGFGPKTLAAVNAQSEAHLLPAFVQSLMARYRAIVAGDPGQAKFLAGWLTRAERLP